MGKKLNAVHQDRLWTDACRKFDDQRREWWQKYGNSNGLKPYDLDSCCNKTCQPKSCECTKKIKVPKMATETSYMKDFPDYTRQLCPPVSESRLDDCTVCGCKHFIPAKKAHDICTYDHCS
ncbi:hypothetical protein AVEN_93985-1 [Araneus ventricosus]|uniref:Uncharacterized protein n=1 Tax=Araneus ventricosus TaxID=182803 RepID=A0A4Y2CLH0_ARAVE|nr:hypothetical protein AVEN_93985-1 [Araneus ventricosus]